MLHKFLIPNNLFTMENLPAILNVNLAIMFKIMGNKFAAASRSSFKLFISTDKIFINQYITFFYWNKINLLKTINLINCKNLHHNFINTIGASFLLLNKFYYWTLLRLFHFLLNLNRLLLYIHHLWQYQHNRTADPAILRLSLTAKEKKLLSHCSATLDSVEEMLLKGLSA